MPDPLPAIFISSSLIESDARESAGAPIQHVHQPSAQSARDIRSARSARAGPFTLGVPPERPYTKDELHAYLVNLRKKCQTTIAGLSDEKATPLFSNC